MDKINATIDRVVVILKQTVTYIIAITTIVTLGVAQLTVVLPETAGAQVAGYGATLTTFLLGVAAVIRRVTPVPASDRGVLPREVKGAGEDR